MNKYFRPILAIILELYPRYIFFFKEITFLHENSESYFYQLALSLIVNDYIMKNKSFKFTFEKMQYIVSR